VIYHTKLVCLVCLIASYKHEFKDSIMKQLQSRKHFKILVACEESQNVASRFYNLGYTVYSCDIQASSNKQYRHIHLSSDVFTVLETFRDIDITFDCVLAFPPCTYLAHVGNRWLNDSINYPNRHLDRELATRFFMKLWNIDKSFNVKHVMLENPKGYIQSFFDKSDYHYIQPFEYGEYASKKTCLFTKNLPTLKPTKLLIEQDERKFTEYFSKLRSKKKRSEFFKGVSTAIAKQYDEYFNSVYRFKQDSTKTYDNRDFDLSIFEELTVK